MLNVHGKQIGDQQRTQGDRCEQPKQLYGFIDQKLSCKSDVGLGALRDRTGKHFIDDKQRAGILNE